MARAELHASSRPSWVRRAAMLSCLVPTTMAWASDAATDARARLTRMHQAAAQQNYQGTMVFSAGGSSSSSRVAHYVVGGQSYERIEALDGREQTILRHNDTVYTVWPRSGVAVVEQLEAMGARGALMQSVEARALEQYELRMEGRRRVADRDAEVFVLQPRDDLRYAQRLWADAATGLMLRADVVGAGSQGLLESAFFSEVAIGMRPQPESVLQAVRRLGGLRKLVARHERTTLEGEGWRLARPLPGFTLSSCVRRPQEAVPGEDARVADVMLQTVFSDGLTQVSLFIERYDAARHRKEVQGQIGAAATRMQRRGEHWLTAMGDVPQGTLKLLLDAIERRP
ncbi:MAG: MucB/RseB C-terminal domain-containing protein [Rubrivivax sp.]|nr:MucB/RseB C-terminal domain-containing protein [Rubrivivax sp.]